MPLSHLTLTVAHLPTSTSFFLSCLQPLGYRFIGRHDNSVGFGAEPGEPADFWISEERPGVPAGAAHIAFPAPSRDAVSAFFIAALKSGGKIHGEPCLRDADQNYYSAAVIDFDGNSIEAVHRPGISPSRPRAGGRALTAIENGSVVSRASKASSAKSRSLVQRHNSAPSEVSSIKAPSMHDFDSQSQSQSRGHGQNQNQNQRSKQTPPATQLPVPPKDNGLTGAKAVVGTLIGAAAGAAAAYAMFRTESQSEAPPKYSEAPSTQPQQAHDYRAIEPAPSDYGYARSSVSKNQKASTIFDGLEQASRILGGAAHSVRGFDEQQQEQQQQQHYFQQQEPRRHSSTTGTVVYDAGSEMNLPIRAIEGIPPDAAMSEWNSMDRYNNHNHIQNPNSSFISSFVDGPVSTTHRRQSDSASVYSSSSTIKPGSNSSRRPPSSRHSQSARSVVTISDIGSYHSRRGRDEGSGSVSGSVYSGMHSARNVPLPMSSINGSAASSRRHSHAPSNHTRTNSRTPSRHSRRSERDYDHNDHAYAQTVLSGTQSIKSYRTSNTITNASQSARAVPLPDDGSTIYFDDVDFDPPEQESRSHHTSGGKSKSSKSKHRSSSATGGSRTSRRSSRYDEPVVPADSVSQVSTNVSRRSGRSRR